MSARVLKSRIASLPYPRESVAKYVIDRLGQLNPMKTVLVSTSVPFEATYKCDSQLDCPSGRRHTSDQVRHRIVAIAAAFIELGLKKGEVVCFVAPNTDYYAIALLAVIAAGGVFTACSDNSSHRKKRVHLSHL